jgi:hypothetical protein
MQRTSRCLQLPTRCSSMLKCIARCERIPTRELRGGTGGSASGDPRLPCDRFSVTLAANWLCICKCVPQRAPVCAVAWQSLITSPTTHPAFFPPLNTIYCVSFSGAATALEYSDSPSPLNIVRACFEGRRYGARIMIEHTATAVFLFMSSLYLHNRHTCLFCRFVASSENVVG